MTTDVINGVPRELKPCPFCGGKAEIEQVGTPRKSTIYRCTDCSCSLETGETFNHGAGWNERALLATAQPAADGEREAFEAAVCERYGYTGGSIISRRVGDYYADASLSQAWALWQARAAQPQQAVAVTDEVRRLREALEVIAKTGYGHGGELAERTAARVLSAHKTGEEE